MSSLPSDRIAERSCPRTADDTPLPCGRVVPSRTVGFFLRILVTGSAGFIGFHLAAGCSREGHEVIGFDDLTLLRSRACKRARLAILEAHPDYRPTSRPLETPARWRGCSPMTRPDVVVHLAAQAGVRYSLENPAPMSTPISSASCNLLEACRAHRRAICSSPRPARSMAPTASCRSASTTAPTTRSPSTPPPSSPARRWRIPTPTCSASRPPAFRFFTVYGPWGRPDMALFKFTEAILAGEPIEVYGEGQAARLHLHRRSRRSDRRLADHRRRPGLEPASLGPRTRSARSRPIGSSISGAGGPRRREMIDDRAALGRPAKRILKPLPPGDVPAPMPHRAAARLIGQVPQTPLEEGIPAFVRWYRGAPRGVTPLTAAGFRSSPRNARRGGAPPPPCRGSASSRRPSAVDQMDRVGGRRP